MAQQEATGGDPRLRRATHALVVAACLVPVLHTATCARLGHEESQFYPTRDPDDTSLDLRELDRGCGQAMMCVGISAALLTGCLLLAVSFRGARWRLFASTSYGPLLAYVGIQGLNHPDLHRWLWGAMSFVAGAILTTFAATRWRDRWRKAPRERSSNVAVLASCVLAALVASVHLPAQPANRVLTDSSLTWTYHRAELKRDPNERIRAYRCTEHAGVCDCFRTGKEEDRGTCGEQRCCYRWDTGLASLLGGPGPVLEGCFCKGVYPASTPCPSPSSFPRPGASVESAETCP